MRAFESRMPGIVASVDRERREVRVEIPGVTDGAEELPIAEIEYPIGDNSEHTEIRIMPGDRVFLAFLNGDPRYPIITGYRPKQTGNEVGTRRWHHDNIETEADETQRHTAGESIELAVQSAQIKITPGEISLEVAGQSLKMSAAGFELNGTAFKWNGG